ncbi:alpha/beta fold hydrolase [Cognatishimia activa]|uniref:Haloacetate dehalogenase H-1 n=1 Tax=Cognatishimia activa TaxID=1715691 RepID=A0A0P1IU07_9RHOB|nr:alpha/beta hydrolase [Cognatishimia activa]CUJ35657.1 Haloacetate dehalogenase H-1 [Cognatishimia activa]CUK27029.1 Haloacetate dehalogenase H-1 [Cognatishimia activa]
MFDRFESIMVGVETATIHAKIGGEGAPLLLLHGYPQTHMMWHPFVDELAKTHRVVVADLRGYGDSIAHDADFSFRAMARDQVALMNHLGFESFHVISHDRGSRTAHRMVLDHPEAVKSIVLMDILPTLDVWRTMDDWLAKRYYHWMFLAQPGDMPQRLINAEPITFLHAALLGLAGSNEIFHPRAMAAYERAAQNPDVVAAWCGDYSAGASIDLESDRADEGKTHDLPCLLLWGSKGAVDHHMDPLEAWRKWFPQVQGHELEAGHFIVEEKPEEVLAALQVHLNALCLKG